MGRVHQVSDVEPGIRRVRSGRGFTYRSQRGKRLTDPETLARIRALAIPPAWTDVWICTDPDGHVQATGRDAKGRKQYRYHASWRAARERRKFAMLETFGLALPRIRRREAHDLASSDLTLERVAAGVVLLLEQTMIRVGNEEYVRANGSFGLTTLRSRHARVSGTTVELRFVGKSGVPHVVAVDDPRVATLVAACRRLDGEHLFQYVNGDGRAHQVMSGDVNEYLRAVAREDVTAKDFRTWMATVMAGSALVSLPTPSSATAARREANAVLDAVAARLRNTRAVCRASYVHPALLTSYADGSLGERWQPAMPATRGLGASERALLGFLRTLNAESTPRAA
ncbi:MAG TPA: DNA topoisomerase IB [Acidimicrobiia bacterium]|jgi:DNA topoisomerase-1